MKLQVKLAVFVACLAIISAASIFVLFNLLIVEGFSSLEEDYVTQVSTRLEYAVEERTGFLLKTVADWAVWDDTYDYIKEPYPEYLESNLADSTFESLRINGIIILNDSGEIVAFKYYDYQSREEIGISENSRDQIVSALKTLGGDDSGKGLLMIDGRRVLYAAHRIYSSDYSLESDGYVIFVKYLDSDEVNAFNTYVSHPVQIFDPDGFVFSGTEGLMQLDEKTYMRFLPDDYVEAYVILDDAVGRPVAVARILIHRAAFASVADAFSRFVTAQFFAVLILGCVFFLLVEIAIVERIKRVDRTITRMIDSGDLTHTIKVDQDDEIGHLSKNFNTLAGIINEDKKQLTKKNSELENANSELRKLDELKNDFIANMSHEFRTPITCIQSYSQLMEEGMLGPITDKQKGAVAAIRTCARNLNGIINSVLDIAKYESGNMKLDPSEFRLCEAFNEIKTEFRPTLAQIGGTLNMDVDSSLMVYADRGKTLEVLRNLVSNAIKYKSQRPLVINARAGRMGSDYFIYVRDNGTGLKDEHKQNLFNRFYQADHGIARKVDGAGLGLSIVKSIVELHGGTIEVDSRFDEYTEFRIRIPARKP